LFLRPLEAELELQGGFYKIFQLANTWVKQSRSQ